MPEFIYSMSSTQLFIFLNVVLFLISLGCVSLVRRHISLDFRYEENTAIVSCSALLGIIYAILIGFTILYQFNAFDKITKDETTEGLALYNIFHNATAFPPADTAKIQGWVLAYAKNAVDNEWPALDKGQPVDSKGHDLIENLSQEIRALNAQNLNGKTVAILNTMTDDVAQLLKTHHERTAKVHTTLDGHIWFVLTLATLFTLGMNYLLGMEFRLHIFCLTLISIVMSSVLYLIVSLDRPYQGDFVVHPETIETLLQNDA